MDLVSCEWSACGRLVPWWDGDAPACGRVRSARYCREAAHQVLSAIWVWSEKDVRRMVAQAGFSDIAIHYASASGNSPLAKIADRLAGTTELRLVRGIKA